MADKTIHIEVVTPERVVFSGEIKELSAPGIDGDFGVLPGHTPFATVLKTGVVTIKKADNTDDGMAISGGYIEVTAAKITLLVETAEIASEIDPERAKKKLEEKERLLKSKTSKDFDFDKVNSGLMKEIARLKVIDLVKRKRK
ncbi:MAG: ATP synthase F1 subunit epsilon [bacterium]